MGKTMNRFKVKDLLISAIGEGVLREGAEDTVDDKVCAQNDPRTRVHCIQDEDAYEDTEFACKEKSDTEVPCGANSDTSLDCAGLETYLPCVKRKGEPDTQVRCSTDKGIPDIEKTKFRCVFKKKPKQDTRGVCRGGTDTSVPGYPGNPWWGCVLNQTRVPCADMFDTKKPCLRKGDEQTTYACQDRNKKEEKTKHPCQKTKKREYWTDYQCGKIDTSAKCWSNTDWCTLTWSPKTPYADVGQSLPLDQIPVFEDNGCGPLSALQIPDDDPALFDALAQLRADLHAALGLVDARSTAADAALKPQSVDEATKLEKMLEAALADVRAEKARLGESAGANENTATRSTKKRSAKPKNA